MFFLLNPLKKVRKTPGCWVSSCTTIAQTHGTCTIVREACTFEITYRWPQRAANAEVDAYLFLGWSGIVHMYGVVTSTRNPIWSGNNMPRVARECQFRDNMQYHACYEFVIIDCCKQRSMVWPLLICGVTSWPKSKKFQNIKNHECCNTDETWRASIPQFAILLAA